MIYLGTDHRGFELKNFLIEELKKSNIKFKDLGAYEYDKEDDYPLIAFRVAKEVIKNKNNRGILFCGSGIGVCIAANRIKGIRAACSDNIEIIKKAREDDDINILCIPSDFVSKENTLELIDVFLNTNFKNKEKYLRRIKELDNTEEEINNLIDIDYFKKIELKIGKIENAEKIEGTKLFKIIVNIGSEKRNIVAGLGEKYTIQDLNGQLIVVLTNLKPKNIRGIESNGMLLAVDSEKGPVIVVPLEQVKVGSRVR